MVFNMRHNKLAEPTFRSHAVKRLVERRVPIDVIVQIAQVGVTVQAKRDRVVKRGDFRGQPIHVVLDTVKNEVVTEYFANEWESRIEVRRRPPMVAAAF